MKKVFKYIIITVLLLISTGCSGNYNININEDMSVDEELQITILDRSDLYQKTIKIFEEADIPKDNYDVNISNGNIEILYKESYPSIEEYTLSSNVYHQLFNEIRYNSTSKYIDLYTEANIKQKNLSTEINGTNLTDFDFIQVNVTNPFEVKFTNAEIINDNTYTWTIKNTDSYKKFQMQFKPSLNIFPYREVIVGSTIILCIIIIVIVILKRFKKSTRV